MNNIFVQKPLLQFTFMSQVLYDMIKRDIEKSRFMQKP